MNKKDDDTETGNTASNQGQSGAGEGTSSNDDARLADLQAQLNRYNGDALRLAEKQHERIYSLRQRAQEAEASAPKEGQVIMSADQQNLLAEYKKLGTPEELLGKQSQLTKLERYQMVSNAAGVAGMNPNVLNKLLPDNATLEIGEAKDEDGNATRQVLLKTDGEDPKSIDEYAKSNWADFLPALVGSSKDDEQGKPWAAQTGSSTAKPNNGKYSLVKDRLERRKKIEAPSETIKIKR